MNRIEEICFVSRVAAEIDALHLTDRQLDALWRAAQHETREHRVIVERAINCVRARRLLDAPAANTVAA